MRGFHEWFSVLTPHTAKTSSGEVMWTCYMLEAFRKLCVCLCDLEDKKFKEKSEDV